MSNHERNLAIVKARKSGRYLQDIAQEYGLCRERISQICKGVQPNLFASGLASRALMRKEFLKSVKISRSHGAPQRDTTTKVSNDNRNDDD